MHSGASCGSSVSASLQTNFDKLGILPYKTVQTLEWLSHSSQF